MGEVSRRARRSQRFARAQRAELALVDCLTAEVHSRKAEDSLRADELSQALSHLEIAAQAIKRAKRMVSTGR